MMLQLNYALTKSSFAKEKFVTMENRRLSRYRGVMRSYIFTIWNLTASQCCNKNSQLLTSSSAVLDLVALEVGLVLLLLDERLYTHYELSKCNIFFSNNNFLIINNHPSIDESIHPSIHPLSFVDP